MRQDEEDTAEDSSETSEEALKRRKFWKYTGITVVLFIILIIIITVPVVIYSRNKLRTPKAGLAIESNFPDPGLVRFNDTWYAFSTNTIVNDLTEVFHVPVAVSSDFEHWKVMNEDALPTLADWETSKDHWAPDVTRRDDGRFVLHYSGEAKKFRRHHCIGVAISEGEDPLGPYVPELEPLACHLDDGGAIDSSGFIEPDGTPYVLYKVDGNSIGNGGDCNNGVNPLVSTPILLQKLDEDQVTTDGEPVQILDRDESDGPLIEAPHLVKSKEGIYFLFFSSHCFTSPRYNVNYATASKIEGPYIRASKPLLQTGDFGLLSPGGATVSADGTKILFHGNCTERRCMYAGDVVLNGTHASIDLVKEGKRLL